LAFVASAPFDIAAPPSRYAHYAIIVGDSALKQYNEIFRYFEPSDTSRSTVYQRLPEELFWSLPITETQHISFRDLGTDTLLATVVHQRPDRDLFSRRFGTELQPADSLAPTDEQRAGFRSALRRIRQELQEIDTAFIWATPGPRIVRMRTASGIRDSVVRDSVARVARVHLERLAADVRLRLLEFHDFSTLGGSVTVGGSIKGTVDPGDAGWFRDDRLYVGMAVQCEGRRGGESTTEFAYLSLPDVENHQRADYLCLWVGDQGTEWTRVRPSAIRVRLVAHVRNDSVFGPWVAVR
jgi:hypothetical protein